MNKFADMTYPDAKEIEDGQEAQDYARVLWMKNPLNILEATSQHMWNWAYDEGMEWAKGDRDIMQQYNSNVSALAYSWAGDKGIRTNVVAGLCDVARAGFVRGYNKFVDENPLVCTCCGQPLPPKEG